ncbi:hypothetical protein TNCV_474941 [Trichonephila clavipes]|nr:hypothetical protein TNCV_474941 [Trichonephila clavipes]
MVMECSSKTHVPLTILGWLLSGLKGHPTAPTNFTELWKALVNIWQVIPVERFQKHIESMPRRVEAVIMGKRVPQITTIFNRLRGSEHEFPSCLSKVTDSIMTGFNRFSGCENRRYACHMIMWHVNNFFSIKLALVQNGIEANVQPPTRA